MYNRKSISDYYRDIFEKIRSEILRETDSTIIGTDPTHLAEYYFQRYALSFIQIDESQEITWDLVKYIKTIKAHERDHFYQSQGDFDFDCERIDVEIPIIENENIRIISELQSSSFSISYSEKDFNFSPEKIRFSIETKWYRFSYTEEQITQNLSTQISRARELISWKNKDIEVENRNLEQTILKIISERRKKISEDAEKLASLIKKIDIPLKKKENLSARRIEVSQKPVVKKVKPSPEQPEEYILDHEKVIDIISFLDNQGKQFEKTPWSYLRMGEEALRDVLLVSLNSIFEGKATGETFSKRGKTDIYLNINKWNILVFECKFWKGEKLYHETIHQLRGYLTWRHNFGVMITFSRNKNFSEVLRQIETIIKWSNSFINSFRKINETHYVSHHIIEGDTKEVEVHHLFYNLFI